MIRPQALPAASVDQVHAPSASHAPLRRNWYAI